MAHNLPILYSFRRCPYAMRARFALYFSSIPHEHREIMLKDKPIEMLDVSPKGTVPVLILNDGTVLEQSLDIMKWALRLDKIELAAELLIQENDTDFKHALDRYKYPGRYEEEPGIDYRHKGSEFIKKLDKQLSPFLTGEDLSFLDMAIFPFIRQFVAVDPAWFGLLHYDNIQYWLNAISSSSLFERIMQKQEVWDKTRPPTLIHP